MTVGRRHETPLEVVRRMARGQHARRAAGGQRAGKERLRLRTPKQEHRRQRTLAQRLYDLASKRLPTAVLVAPGAADFNGQHRIQEKDSLASPAVQAPVLRRLEARP